MFLFSLVAVASSSSSSSAAAAMVVRACVCAKHSVNGEEVEGRDEDDEEGEEGV